MKFFIFFNILIFFKISSLACGPQLECYNCNVFLFAKAFQINTQLGREPDLEIQNELEWKTYFKDNSDEFTIWKGTYNLPKENIDTIIHYLKKETLNLDKDINTSDANFINLIKSANPSKKLLNALYYLAFAKSVDNNIESSQNKSIEYDDSLEKKALRNLPNISNTFIKDKYYYQLTKLHYYIHKNADEFFEENKNHFTNRDSSYYRSLSYAAGQASDSIKSNYIFAQIYEKAPYLRYSAYGSFAPNEKSDWQNLQNLKISREEKENIYYLFGHKYDVLEGINLLLKINPQSKHINQLIYQFAYEIEKDGFEFSITSNKTIKNNISILESNLSKYNLTNSNYYNLLLSIYYLYNSQFTTAFNFLKKIKTKDASLKTQIRMTKLQIKIKQFSKPNLVDENYFAQELFWLQSLKDDVSDNLILWSHEQLGLFYKNRNDLFSVLLKDQQSDFFLDNNNLDKIIFLRQKKNKTLFEKYITQNKNSNSIYYKNNYLDNTEIKNMMGFNFFFSSRFNEALKNFDEKTQRLILSPNTLNSNILEKYNFNIEFAQIDTPQKQNVSTHSNSDNDLTLKNLLLRLDNNLNKIKANNKSSNFLKLEIANAIYSFSNEGENSYFIRSTLPHYYLVKNLNVHMSLVKPLFLDVLSQTQDKELEAKIAFRLAKIERNEFYYQEWETENIKLSKDSPYYGPYYGYTLYKSYSGKYFDLLKEKYKNTQYYKEIIESCETFKNWEKKQF